MTDGAPDQESLDDLCLRAVAGDPAAEAALFETLRVRFLQVAKQRVREDDLEDVVQEGLRIASGKYRSRAANAPILPWSFAILRNVVGNYYKRLRTERRFESLGERDFGAEVPTERSALRERIVEAVRILAKRHPRCAVIFRGVLRSLDEGGTAREMSRRTLELVRRVQPEMTPGAFHVALHRCRSKLKDLIEELSAGGPS